MSYFSNVKSIMISNKYFYITHLLLLAIGLPYIIGSPKEESLLFINSMHSPQLDFFFKYITNVGDGLFIVALLLPFLLVRVKYSILLLSTNAITGAIVQIAKKIADVPRPKKFLSDQSMVHFVEGVTIHSYNSFPSGHTATSFALFLLIALLTDNKKIAPIFVIMALIVGISRVYLVEHFLIDVYFGSIFGVVICTIIYAYLANLNSFLTGWHLNFSYLQKWTHNSPITKKNNSNSKD